LTAPLALSLGCPSGIGPEVAVVAAAASRERILLVGDARVVARAAKLRQSSTAISTGTRSLHC